jgi:hypothetical protein
VGAINADCEAWFVSAYSSADFDNDNVFNLIVPAGTKVKSEQYPSNRKFIFVQ